MNATAARRGRRGVPRAHRGAALLASGLWAGAATASFNGPLGPLDPVGAFVIAAVFALPTAAVCVLVEAILPRRRLPFWLAVATALVAAAMLVLALGALAATTELMGKFAVLWFVVPPVATLALRGLLPRPVPRLAAGVGISIFAVVVGAALQPKPDTIGILAGGATACVVLWTVTVAILRAMGWTPPHTTDATGSMNALAAVIPPADFSRPEFLSTRNLGPRLSGWFEASLSRRRGAGWWLATTLVLYLGIGLLITLGGLRGGMFFQHQVWALSELFQLPQSQYTGTRLWWTFGPLWSLLVAAAAWGVAGIAGGFDAGRLRAVRLSAIVLGGLLLLWSASVAWNIHSVWSAEEAASGVR